MKFSEKDIEQLIQGIEDGTITALNLPLNYYNALTDYLSKAVFTGFNATLDTVSRLDLPLLEELVTNVYMFGAAKTFQQTVEMSSLLVDEEGNVRSSRDFNRIARETYDNWNNNWGRTEYNTAIGQADMAAKWAEIERQKDIMPNLEYSAVMDPNTSDICAPLDGIIAPVDDPIWDKIMPLNHFNCRCVVLQTSDPATPAYERTVDGMIDKMQDVFLNNPGKTGLVFTKDHPYFDVANKYREFAKANFNLPLPKFVQNTSTPHPFEPSEFAKWNIKLDPRVYDLLERPVDVMESTRGSSYDPAKNRINLDRGSRYKNSEVYRTKVVYHELGHAIHEQAGLIKFSKSVSDEYAKHFKELKKKVKEPWDIDGKIAKLVAKAASDKSILKEYGCKNIHDFFELSGSTRDALMALTSSRYGAGHTKKYMKLVGAKEAEMFAHSCENFFGGNKVFEEVMPEVYNASREYIGKLITNKTKTQTP